MLAVSEPGALNCCTSFHLIRLTLFVSRNLTSTYLPFSGSLDSLLCVLITPTPGLAFSLLMPCTLAAGSSFSSGRAYPSLSFLPPLFLCLIPTLNMQGSTSLLTAPPRCHFLMIMLPYSLFPNGWQNQFLLSLPSFFLHQKSLHSERLQLPSPSLRLKRYFRPLWDEVFDWVISSDLLLLNDPDIPTLLHRSSGSRSYPDNFFASFSLALSCSWEVLQDLGSDHLPILLTVSFSPVFRPTNVPHPSIFKKLVGMTLRFTSSFTVLLKRNTRLFLFSLLLLSLLL